MDKTKKLGEMKVSKLLLTMSLPAIISMLVQATYNMVDSVFISQVNEASLTAVSLSFSIQMVIVAIFVGLGIGITSIMSRRLGEGNRDEATNVAEHGIVIGIFMWVILAILGLTIPRWFFNLFTDDQAIINYGVEYISIIMIFSFGKIFSQVAMSILRATGDVISSMKIQLLGAISNIILDPFLIFGWLFFPAFGIRGAAIATVIGQMLSMTYALILLYKSRHTIKLSPKKFHFKIKTISEIFKIGLPAMIMQSLGSVMIAGLNFILAEFSSTAVAVLGVYYRLQSLIFLPVFGLAQGMMPIIGYNYGAKNKKRVVDTVKFALKIASGIMLFGLLVFQFFPVPLLRLFNASEIMMDMGITAFRTISLGFLLAAITIVFSTAFQAFGEAVKSLVLSFFRMIVILLPCAYIMSITLGYGVVGVWFAFPISEVACFMLAIFLTIKIYKNKVMGLGVIDVISD